MKLISLYSVADEKDILFSGKDSEEGSVNLLHILTVYRNRCADNVNHR